MGSETGVKNADRTARAVSATKKWNACETKRARVTLGRREVERVEVGLTETELVFLCVCQCSTGALPPWAFILRQTDYRDYRDYTEYTESMQRACREYTENRDDGIG